MHPILSRLALAFGLSLLLTVPARAGDPKKKGPAPPSYRQAMKQLLSKADEEYRIFFKKPESTAEFWAAIKLEIQVGKFDLAALHLKHLLEQKPPEKIDADLVQIEDAEGFSTFLRLRNVRQWTDHPEIEKEAEKNVESLIDRATKAVEKYLADPVRLKKFIDNLSAPTAQERAFAFAQLQRARGRASPYLVQALRGSVGKPHHQRILEAMVKLDPDIIPPLLEALNARDAKDAADTDLRLGLLEVIRLRGDRRAVPYLWHLSASRRYPEAVRLKAAETLATLLQTDPRALPPANVMLTRLAEDLYQHRVKFLDPKRIPWWPWLKDHTLATEPIKLMARDYEEIFGTRYARQALELDPAYRPAQVAFLNLTLERAYEDKLDQFLLGKTVPSLDQLLTTIDADVVTEVLERALAEHNLAVILPTIKALGERGVVRAARPGTAGTPGPLVRALYYPDRRVQFAAANALLRMPSSPLPPEAARVVEVLRRFVAAAPAPKALIAFAPDLAAAQLRKQVQAAGFEPVVARNLKEVFAALHQAADIDVILVHYRVGENELPYVLSQLHADGDAGLLPVLLLAPVKGEAPYVRYTNRGRYVAVLPEAFLNSPDESKMLLENAIKLAAAPDSVLKASRRQDWVREDLLKRKGQKLSAPERKQLATESLDALWKMARGQIKGYNVRAAEATVVDALRNDDTAVPAIEILMTFPGATTQQRLADVVLDAARGKRRVTAAEALNRHVQRYGLGLTANQVARLRQLAAAPGADANLRAQLAVFVGGLRATAEQTGTRLFRFNPDAPAGKQ